MNEENERLPRGPKGDKGDEGVMPRSARRSLFARDVVIIVLLLLNFLFTASYVNRQQEENAKAAAKEIGALCADVGTMAKIPPPAGDPKTNPSRAYEQAENRTWQGLFTSIRCR